MHSDHPVFITPDDKDCKIWRYMDFTKLVALVDKQALHFTRADRFDDPFEGSYGYFNNSMRSQVYRDLDPNIQNQMAKVYEKFRRLTLINCWHINEDESAAMWRLYLQCSEGIAIQSTFNRLKDSFNATNEQIHIGKVQYVDYKTTWIPEGNSMYPYTFKRRSFEHEKELRALIQNYPEKDGMIDIDSQIYVNGMDVSVNTDILIESIFISPLSPTWFHDLVDSVMHRFGFGIKIVHSSLRDSPLF